MHCAVIHVFIYTHGASPIEMPRKKKNESARLPPRAPKPPSQLAIQMRDMKTRWHNDEVGIVPYFGSAICLGKIIRNAIAMLRLTYLTAEPISEPHAYITIDNNFNITTNFNELTGKIEKAIKG
jgi:hypothetical protein